MDAAPLQQFDKMRLRSRCLCCDQAIPFIIQLQPHMRSAQMRIAVSKPPLVLTRKIEIVDPLMSFEELAAFSIKMQRRTSSMANTDAMFVAFNRRVEFMRYVIAMMAAVIHQEVDSEMYGTLHGMSQTPREAGRMLVGFHPDTLLHDQVTHNESPYRCAAIELKRFNMYQSFRLGRAAAPAIGEQRPGACAVMQRSICLDKYESPLQRRIRRRNEQAMVAPRETLGDRAAGISAKPVRQPPLAPAGLFQVAADCAAKMDKIRQFHT